MHRRYSLLGAAALAVTSFAAGAHAQNAPPSGGGAAMLEEVVVTAEKREANLQTVPVAVSAFTSERRDTVGIRTLQDITNFTPGLSYSTGTDRVSLRGIGRLTNNLASEPGVANYLDGIYTVFTADAGLPPLFVDRVEVLRGPQGTLYGRNSIGGAINTITKRPPKTFSGEVRAIYENYDHKELQALVGGPITEGLRFSLGGIKIKQDQGWFHNLAGGWEEGGVTSYNFVQAQLEADLGESVDAWLKLTSASYKNRGTPGGRTSGSILGPQDPALITPGSLSPGAGYGFQSGQNILALGPARNSAVFTTGDLTAFSTNQPNQAHQPPDHNIQAQVTWHGPGVDVKYIGGYRDYFYDLRTDYDNTALLAYTIPLNATAVCRFVAGCQPLRFSPNVIFEYIEDKSFWSNEVNISSTYDSPLQWIVGAYEYQETYHQPVIITEPDVPQLATPSAAPANPQRIIYYTDQNMRTRTQAAFGQVDWKVTEALKITAGLRYTFDKKKGYEQGRLFCYGCSAAVDPRNLGALTPVLDITSGTFNGGPPAGFAGVQKGVTAPAVTDPVTGIRRRGLGDTWDAWTGTLGAEWSPDADTLVYAKYSRGYKAGGFNSGTLAGLPETDSEHVDAYEIGAKKDWGTTLRTNVSAFWYDYQDAQVPVSTQPTAGPLTTIFYNIPKIRNMGVELETIWSPIEDLQILFNYSYLDAKIREGCCIQDTADPAATAPGAKPVAGTAGLQDVSGNHMPVSPRNKVSLNANYTWRLGIGNVNASGSYVWRDKVYSSIFDRPYYLADARGQVDARVTWTDTDDRYRVILYGKNLTDEQDYDTLTATRQSTGALNETYVLIPPRTYGVELQYRF